MAAASCYSWAFSLSLLLSARVGAYVIAAISAQMFAALASASMGDIAIFSTDANTERMFSDARYSEDYICRLF